MVIGDFPSSLLRNLASFINGSSFDLSFSLPFFYSGPSAFVSISIKFYLA